MLSATHTAAIIIVMAAVTLLTRALPFILFDRGEHPPKIVLYLGHILPPAIIAMLVVYCLSSVSFTQVGNWAPEAIAVATVIGLHVWKGNNLLSIFGGTILYMILVQGVFL